MDYDLRARCASEWCISHCLVVSHRNIWINESISVYLQDKYDNMIHLQQQLDLKQLIKQSKYTQKQLAKQMNMSEQWLSKLLSKDIKDISLGDINIICTACGYRLEIAVIQA